MDRIASVTAWAAVTDPELAGIANAQWRWPGVLAERLTEVRNDAVVLARRFARDEGFGNVVKLELGAAVVVDAEYLGAVPDAQIREAEEALGLRFPDRWRRYVQSDAWFQRGWMRTGAYVWLYSPEESARHVRAWGNRPTGMLPIGGDGATEYLTIDARDARGRVTLTASVTRGWEGSIEQSASLDTFLAAVEAGSFEHALGG